MQHLFCFILINLTVFFQSPSNYTLPSSAPILMAAWTTTLHKPGRAKFCSTKWRSVWYKSFFIQKWDNPGLFFFYFWSFQTNSTIFTTNQCENMACPSSIRHWDSNQWPLKHESSPITTKPGLPPIWRSSYHCDSPTFPFGISRASNDVINSTHLALKTTR